MAKRARLCGLNPIATHELALPTEDRQMRLDYDAPDEIPEPVDEPEN